MLLSKETSITLIATQNKNLFFGHPCTYTHRKKACFQLLSLKTFHKVSSLIYLTTFLCKVSLPFVALFLSVILVKYSCHFQCKLHLCSMWWPYIFINDSNSWLKLGVIKVLDSARLTKENSKELEPSNYSNNSSKHSSKGHKTQHSWAQGHVLVPPSFPQCWL